MIDLSRYQTDPSLDFSSLEPRVLLVPVGEDRYLLREAGEGAAADYRAFILRITRRHQSGKDPEPGQDFPHAQAFLVSRCLTKLDVKTGEEAPLSEEAVRALGSRVVKPMFEWVLQNSD